MELLYIPITLQLVDKCHNIGRGIVALPIVKKLLTTQPFFKDKDMFFVFASVSSEFTFIVVANCIGSTHPLIFCTIAECWANAFSSRV